MGVDGLSLDVAEGVTIQVRDISIEFDIFDWEYKKSSFPSTSDAGRAATTVIDLCITVSFRIGASRSTLRLAVCHASTRACAFAGTSETSRLEVRDLGAEVDMTALNIEVRRPFWLSE